VFLYCIKLCDKLPTVFKIESCCIQKAEQLHACLFVKNCSDIRWLATFIMTERDGNDVKHNRMERKKYKHTIPNSIQLYDRQKQRTLKKINQTKKYWNTFASQIRLWIHNICKTRFFYNLIFCLPANLFWCDERTTNLKNFRFYYLL
jgi:hypothetical protein